MARPATKFVNVFTINDQSSDSPIIYWFDTKETRDAFLSYVDDTVKASYRIIDEMSARDRKTLGTNSDQITADDLPTMKLCAEAGGGDPYHGLSQNEETMYFYFYDAGYDLRDIPGARNTDDDRR